MTPPLPPLPSHPPAAPARGLDVLSETPGVQAVEVAALLGDSVVGVRHVSDPRGGRLGRGTLALFGLGSLLLVVAMSAFVYGVKVARADRVARARWIEVDNRPAWEFRPTRIGQLGDVAALGGLIGGLGCVAWALARARREREPASVTIGHGAGVDFATELVGGERFALVAPRGDGFVLRVPAGVTGEVITDGAARALGALGAARAADGGLELDSAVGARYRLAAGPQHFVVAAVTAPRRQPAGGHLERRVLGFVAGSALAHLLVLALLKNLSPDGRSLNDDQIGADGRMISVRTTPREDALAKPPEPGTGGEAGEEGARMTGVEGAMGDPKATAATGRYTHKKTQDQPVLATPRDPLEARALAAKSGILGYYQANPDVMASLTGTAEFSSGLDERTVRGGHLGDQIGEAAGGWGYGIYGFGPGGGSRDGTTIAVGEYGLGRCGAGEACSGGDRGWSTGDGPGDGRKHRSLPPIVKIKPARSEGGLPKEIIRQYVHRKLVQIRHCYERALIGKPALSGTTVARFQISPEGVVQGSGASGLDREVDGCVAEVLGSIQFPRAENGGYTNVTSYPFTFASPGSDRE